MPLRHRTLLPTFLLALFFALLFHRQGLGLNVLLFELALLGLILWQRKPALTLELGLGLGGTMLSAVFVVLNGSDLARTVNVLFAVIVAGALLVPGIRALHHAFALGVAKLIPSQRIFFSKLKNGSTARWLPRLGKSSWATLLALFAVVGLFMVIYQTSNPHFDALMNGFWEQVAILLVDVDLGFVFTFMLGLASTNLLLQRSEHPRILVWMQRSNDALLRVRDGKPVESVLGLRYELRTGVLLLGLLNALLLVVNLLDIRHVWFSFTFDGQYLKQFVHEGTYLLLISILFGAVIVLWFFRANQNFHKRNRTLKVLANIWLAQNMVLALSVGIRNYWYIHHYALAYRRIGVVFFLLAVLVALVLVGLKVKNARSRYFLLRWNAFSLACVLLIMAAINWDVLIARYNFSKQDQSFIHLDYMSTLSDKALPWLAQERHALVMIDMHNQAVLSDSFSRSLYMEPRSYADVIAARAEDFLREYPERSWRSWNYADARAYRLLKAARITARE